MLRRVSAFKSNAPYTSHADRDRRHINSILTARCHVVRAALLCGRRLVETREHCWTRYSACSTPFDRLSAPARSLEFERSIKATSRRQQQQQQLQQQRRRRRRRRQQWIDRYTRPDERCFSSRDGQPAGSYSRTAAEEKHRPTTTTPSALTLISARPREHVF